MLTMTEERKLIAFARWLQALSERSHAGIVTTREDMARLAAQVGWVME